jgi:hypothetical protein
MLPLPMRAHLHLLLWAALAAHLAMGLGRVPASVFGKRLAEVSAWQCEGPAHYLFRTTSLTGVGAVDELLRVTPADAVIVWRGETKGPMEFAAALLWPRLLIAEQSLPADATRWQGRPVASWPDGPGQLLLVAERSSLRLARR